MKKDNTASQEEIRKLIDDEDTGFDSKVEESIKSENRRLWRWIFIIVFGLITVLVVGCMVSIYNAAYNVHPYFGYGVGILMLVLLFVLLGIPTIRIFFLPYYTHSKKGKNSPLIRHNNALVVKRVSQNLIDYHANTSQGYVSEDNLKNLALSLAGGKRTEINSALKHIYDTDVNSKVRSIILKSATKAFCTTAISQNDKVDALSVLFIDVKMIKSILFAYGTRPSMYKLVKIYTHIIINSLIAYGMQNISVSNILTKFVKATANLVPALGTLIDSAVQGATGAILTMIIGYKTKAYVYKEFKMVVKEEAEYDKENYADRELELALEDYNNSKGLMQKQVQVAKKGLEETTKEKNKQDNENYEEQVIEPEIKETKDQKRKRLAQEDLNLMLNTGSVMKSNGKKKKTLSGGEEKEKKKHSFSWSVHTNKDKKKPTKEELPQGEEKKLLKDSNSQLSNEVTTEEVAVTLVETEEQSAKRGWRNKKK